MIQTARLLLLLLVMGAVALAIVATRTQPAGIAVGGGAYTCPMHPQVRSSSPGECPICRMTLVSVASRPAAAGGVAGEPSTVFLPPEFTSVPHFGVNQANRVLVSRSILAPASFDEDAAGSFLLYRDEAELLEPDERAMFVPAITGPTPLDRELPVRVLRDPPVDWDDGTVRVRFEATGPSDLVARRGAVGWVRLVTRIRPALLVPRGAIVRTPRSPVIYVPSGDGRTFSRRKVVLGRVLFGMVAIVSGLSDGERIVASSAPFLETQWLAGVDAQGSFQGAP
jgi:Heavy metal binding domain